MDLTIKGRSHGILSFFFHSASLDLQNVITMGNSIIGVSILAMPWCFAKVGVLLGTILLILGGWLTRQSCTLLLDASIANRCFSYEYLSLMICGKWAKLAVEICTIGFLLGVCVAFLVTMADLLPPVISRLLNVPESGTLRALTLTVIAIFIALPLSLVYKISNLSNLSAFSIAFYILLALKVFLDALANPQGPNSWYRDSQSWAPQNFLAVFPIFATGLSCQTQVFVMYESLSEPSPHRMKGIIADAVFMCILLYWSVGFFGYLAFSGTGVKGDILLNLTDTALSDVVKILYAVTAAISFPLCIFPCQRSVETLINKSGGIVSNKMEEESLFQSTAITVILVVITLVTSLFIPDIETILNLSGSTMGAFICFVLPAVIVMRTAIIQAKGPMTISTLFSVVIVLAVGIGMMLACLYQVSFVAILQPWLWQFSDTQGDFLVEETADTMD
ncbi:putative sodium-coupled neutral amino acid transporter 10 [Hypsibius exemplaris]|uniref:Sodium-coupled neutral amino acid transporter 10 n=1 Tax=Hypsibius exemplaris TaxID=2072580 RepID=A0A1W0WF80_HYPEX|nr:putative sodium-coupled neutral amino acid transporter 10 [Hypsibius exemplaris]